MAGGSAKVRYLQATVFFPILHANNSCDSPLLHFLVHVFHNINIKLRFGTTDQRTVTFTRQYYKKESIGAEHENPDCWNGEPEERKATLPSAPTETCISRTS